MLKIEKSLKELFSLLVRLTLIPLLMREVIHRNKATVIQYHKVTPAVFKKHLKYLTRYYNVISLDMLISGLKGQGEWDRLPKKSVIITLDDGFSGNYDLIAVLDEFKVPVTIFVRPDGFSGNSICSQDRRYLNKKEVAELLKHRASIGAHSMTHPYLSQVSDADAVYEINGAKEYLEKELSTPIRHFAYPYGDYGERELDIMKKSSAYLSARTVNPGWISFGTNPYELRSMGMSDDAGISKMILDTIGVFPFLRIARRRFSRKPFNRYKGILSYVTGILNLRGPIAQHTKKQADLIRKYAKDRKRVVEIGVSEGGSASIALSVIDPKGKVWLIDPYRSSLYPFFSLSRRIAGRVLSKFKDMDITFLRDYSYAVARRWDIKFDYLLIDACHTEKDFMRDWKDWSPFLEDDGVILIQSVQSPEGIETGAGRTVRRIFTESTSEWKIIDRADATVVIARKK